MVALGGAPCCCSRSACSTGTATRDEARGARAHARVLAGLLVLGDGCERAGLFEALAARIAAAGAAGARLLALVFARRGAVTAVLGLDATVVLLTPAAFAAARPRAARRAARTCTPARTSPTRPRCCCRSPTSRTCWRSGPAGLSFTRFAALMALPWAVAIASRVARAAARRSRASCEARTGRTPGDAPPPCRARRWSCSALTLAGFVLTGPLGSTPRGRRRRARWR